MCTEILAALQILSCPGGDEPRVKTIHLLQLFLRDLAVLHPERHLKPQLIKDLLMAIARTVVLGNRSS